MTIVSEQAWIFLGVALSQLVALSVAIVGGYIKLRIHRYDIEITKRAAEKAVAQTADTGNGFATRVEEALGEISASVRANRDDIMAMRSEALADRQVVIRHLEGHLRPDH